MKPEFLGIGYVIEDLIAGVKQPGGSTYYGSSAAKKLGLNAGIWTSATEEYCRHDWFEGIEIVRSPSEVTTTFELIYEPKTGHRSYRCAKRAKPIDPSTLPKEWRKATLVSICPNGQEVGPDVIKLFDSKKVALLPQGWFRYFHEDGSVTFGKCKFSKLEQHPDLIVASVDDLVADREAWNWMKKSASIAVLTMGARGYILSKEGREKEFTPPYVAKDVDPTGAGDVFSAGMLLALLEGATPEEAARFGSASASYAVEGRGTSTLPTREQVWKRFG